MRRPVLTDCRHFDGYKPCAPHKRSGVHCESCSAYEPLDERILILKLGAAGEVLRCTPLLRYLRQHHPDAQIVWVTACPDYVPRAWVDEVLPFDWTTAERLKATRWDAVYSLDKEPAPCALAAQLDTALLKGFTLDGFGRIAPVDDDARPKFMTGIFDDLMRANRTHYVAELFEVCGWSYHGETYVLPDFEPVDIGLAADAPVIGLNTGAGPVWPTRLWPEAHFAELIDAVIAAGWQPLLLGGPDEADRNARLARRADVVWPGVRPVTQFFDIVRQCDVVVTAVTMALHAAIGLERHVVLLNNIFNRHEFHLFGRGRVVEPDVPCRGCYKRCFDDDCAVPDCMATVTPTEVFDAVAAELALARSEIDAPTSSTPR